MTLCLITTQLHLSVSRKGRDIMRKERAAPKKYRLEGTEGGDHKITKYNYGAIKPPARLFTMQLKIQCLNILKTTSDEGLYKLQSFANN